jgi:Tol biopolymer transport system component
MWRSTMVLSAVAALVVPAVVAASHGATPGLLAYEAPDGIHLVNSDGSGDHRAAGSVHGDRSPTWSPDGRRLVVVHALAGEEGGLVVLDAADGARRPIAGTFGELPTWTPDGSAIVFDSDRGATWQLYSVRPDGSALHLLMDRFSYGASYAADGTLAFVGEGDGRNAAILTQATDRPAHELAMQLDAWAPAWWPDAGALAFATDGDYAGGSFKDWAAEIHRVAADGTDEQRLTHNRFWDGDPAVSPEGTQIAFDTGRFGWLEISVMNADGSQKRRLTRELHGDACCPSWQPAP